MLPSDDAISEHAYLVSRGVRLLAVVGSVENNEESIAEVRDKLHEAATESAGTQAIVPIPFLIENARVPRVTAGFAAHTWIVDLYEWLGLLTGRMSLSISVSSPSDYPESFITCAGVRRARAARMAAASQGFVPAGEGKGSYRGDVSRTLSGRGNYET